jgi:ABC-2 type transport system permease protein
MEGIRPMQSAAELRASAQSRLRWELLVNLVRKDLKVKYKSSTLGFLWTLANPLLYLVVFSLVFTKFLPAGIPDFWVYFMSGLLVWNFFNQATLSATGSVVGSANLVKKVPFPRLVLPLSSVGFAGVHFALQLAVFAVFLLVFYRDAFGPQLLLLIPALAVAIVFSAAMSFLLSSLNVSYRDVQHLYEVALIAGFWLSPIVYQIGVVKDQLDRAGLFWLYMLNPMTTVIASMQRAIYAVDRVSPGGQAVFADPGYAFYLEWLGIAALISLALLALGLWTFRRLEHNFAEEL